MIKDAVRPPSCCEAHQSHRTMLSGKDLSNGDKFERVNEYLPPACSQKTLKRRLGLSEAAIKGAD